MCPRALELPRTGAQIPCPNAHLQRAAFECTLIEGVQAACAAEHGEDAAERRNHEVQVDIGRKSLRSRRKGTHTSRTGAAPPWRWRRSPCRQACSNEDRYNHGWCTRGNTAVHVHVRRKIGMTRARGRQHVCQACTVAVVLAAPTSFKS